MYRSTRASKPKANRQRDCSTPRAQCQGPGKHLNNNAPRPSGRGALPWWSAFLRAGVPSPRRCRDDFEFTDLDETEGLASGVFPPEPFQPVSQGLVALATQRPSVGRGHLLAVELDHRSVAAVSQDIAARGADRALRPTSPNCGQRLHRSALRLTEQVELGLHGYQIGFGQPDGIMVGDRFVDRLSRCIGFNQSVNGFESRGQGLVNIDLDQRDHRIVVGAHFQSPFANGRDILDQIGSTVKRFRQRILAQTLSDVSVDR